ncbi:peptidoglycan-binding protein [Hoeflea poritis]|uniref:Peptidoglycan-binding protein n=1 Tax=Hoeflea poritis TaxID=2993659 RepID=A0ABT4VTM2_9HYPH|nr:peptidoglycan-binding protein [Hoeflea poritis]MDA4848061.1 peptidoglycan-binding protein [Hoeflea poritis]
MNSSRPPRNWQNSRQNSSVDVLNQSIADLEARIDALNNRNRQQPARPQGQQRAPEAEIHQQMAEQLRRPPQNTLPQRELTQREPAYHEAVPQQAVPAGSTSRARRAAKAASPETSNAMRDIAEALAAMRDDMRRDVDEIKTMTGSAAMPGEIRNDLAHLAGQLEALEAARAGHQGGELHRELDELRSLVNELAREESMRRLENRWDGFEERISDLDPAAVREELITLSYRLDDIKSSIGQLPSALPLHALEDKIKMLVGAIDAMSRQPAASDPEVARQFALLDERLDEISRAIVATQNAQASSVDHEAIERLESRMDALVDRIGQIGQSNQTQIGRQSEAHNELSQRLESLTRRVEDLAHEEAISAVAERLDTLTHTLVQQFSSTDPHLIAQIDELSRKVDTIDLESVNAQIAHQLNELSLRIDNINTDLTATNGNQDQLYGRLEELADRVEQSAARETVVDFTPIEMRLADLAARLDESQSPNYVSDDAIRNLEDQVAGLSSLLNNPDPNGESAAVLEPRLAAIEDHLSASRADSQDLVIEAARQAAETAVASFQQNGAPPADMAAVESLVSDLRSLEDLSRRSEERSTRTIDAVHDTLLKIAERLEKLEETTAAPAPALTRDDDFADEGRGLADYRDADRQSMEFGSHEMQSSSYSPTSHEPIDYGTDERDAFELEPAATASAVYPPEAMVHPDDPAPIVSQDDDDMPREDDVPAGKSLLSGLKKRFAGSTRQTDVSESRDNALQNVDPAPSIDPVGDIDPETANMPLEPGSGAPDIKKIMAKVRHAQNMADQDHAYSAESEQSGNGKADFIAAARRAAQAAASEVAEMESVDEDKKGRSALVETVSRSRKPILLAAGAVLLAVISYPLLSGFIGGEQKPVETASVEQPAVVEPATPPVTEPAPVVEPELPKVEVIERQVEEVVAPVVASNNDAAPAQTLSADNQVQPSSSFQPAEPAPVEEVAAIPAEPAAPAMDIELPPETVGPLALREAAASGDSLALFEIGARYTEGRGVATDLGEAAKWYQRSADLGFAPAQYRLANFYEKGSGLNRDVEKAMTWYVKAAEQGNASAMHNLAVLHAMGPGGAADYDAAGKWFTKAADLGVKDSQFNLAILHARGSGVSQDLEETYKWFAIAAKSGDKDAAKKRDEVANALRPEQLESARAKVELWKPAPLIEAANTARIPPEWRGAETRTASVDMTKAVKNIQAILTKNGFDTGGVDGIMGARTVSAIKSFQESVGLEPTGEVDDALVKQLIERNN